MLRVLTILAMFLSASATLAKEQDPFNSGDWPGHIYSSDTTGKFSHCAVSGDYKNGTTLIVSINRNYRWSLAFLNGNWPSYQNVQQINYRFDRGRWYTADSTTGIEGKAFFVKMPQDDSLIGLFRYSHVLEIFFQQKNYKFELKGTSRLLADLAQCVQNQLAFESAPPIVPRENNSVAQTTVETPPKVTPNDTGPSSGSGIVISDKGHILTNFHVVKGCPSFSVVPSGSLAIEAKLLTTDEANDLAVLKVTPALAVIAFAKFRGGRGVKAGEAISVFGYPLVGTLSTSGNFVTGSISSLAGMGDDARMIQISAPIQPGNSGGPLLDSAGSVIGVVNSKLNEIAFAKATGTLPQNVNFAIKANVAMNFLDAHSVPYELETEIQPIESSGVADKARQFTVLVNCNAE